MSDEPKPVFERYVIDGEKMRVETPAASELAAPTGSAISDYNPLRCLQEEVRRFKATNRFTPMDVTGFYIQAAVVLTYLAELEKALDELTASADYVQHRFSSALPGMKDLQIAVLRAQALHRWPNDKLTDAAT